MSVYGRKLYLYDCDEFTRQFYRDFNSLEQAKIDISVEPVVPIKPTIPPHCGVGTEEDSYMNCMFLSPRKPKRDITSILEEGNRHLRFQCKLTSPAAPTDTQRVFILALYLADASISVWEQHRRNSGRNEGKFKHRAKVRNPDAGGAWFTLQDFFIGAVVEVNSIRFTIINADMSTLQQMEERSSDFPVSAATLIVKKLAERGNSLISRLLQLPCSGLEAHSATSIPPLSTEELKNITAEAGVQLSSHELLTLARAYGRQDGTSATGSVDMPMLMDEVRRQLTALQQDSETPS